MRLNLAFLRSGCRGGSLLCGRRKLVRGGLDLRGGARHGHLRIPEGGGGGRSGRGLVSRGRLLCGGRRGPGGLRLCRGRRKRYRRGKGAECGRLIRAFVGSGGHYCRGLCIVGSANGWLERRVWKLGGSWGIQDYSAGRSFREG